LEFTPDPSLRSFVIYHLGRLHTNPNTLATRLESEGEVSIRRALIQSLGGLDASRIARADRSRIAQSLQELYVSDPDPGIHASASWTLRRWDVRSPKLPQDEPVLTEGQKLRIDNLATEVQQVTHNLTEYEQEELPARQAAWERSLPEQPNALAPSLSEGLVADYPLDELEGTEITNAVNGRPGGIYQGPGQPEWVPCIVDGALRLDGRGGHFKQSGPNGRMSVRRGVGFMPLRTVSVVRGIQVVRM
jgi:hypothetical protein